jgi:transcriptional regulator with XRE-family HTH domain
MNQTDLADSIGAKQKSISRYETGLSMLSIESLVKIAKVLKSLWIFSCNDLWTC